jgi:glycosyltransferase involved in cell wall biosynthesis
VRLAVYLDYVHRRDARRVVYAPRAFSLFLAGLRDDFERIVVAGRLDPEPGLSHYRLPAEIGFVEMPHYSSAADPLGLARALLGGLRRWNTLMDDVDVAWILGPQGLAVPIALLSLARGRRVVLGVRQDLPDYARRRHPGRPLVHVAADALDASFRALARFTPAIVVGQALAARYGRGRSVLPIAVSLVSERQLEIPPPSRSWDGPLTVLSVGRLEEEKNPLLLADVLAALRAGDPRWRLVICGEGPLEGALRERLAALGVADAAELRGYVPVDGDELARAYSEAHVLLHVSWTEGVPQVLFEAFAAGLPIVATAVGGVAQVAGSAVRLVAPGNAAAAAEAVRELAADPHLRERLTEAGLARARASSLEAELARTAAFLKGDPQSVAPAGAGMLRPAVKEVVQ